MRTGNKGPLSQAKPRYKSGDQMANRHSLMWRAPGRRSAEQEKFRRLIKKVEAVRVREGMTKTKLAAALGTTPNALRNWMAGRTIGRKETVAKIKDFLKQFSSSGLA
jgi:DNA-binding transcriptional regulator YiaG